MKIQIVNEKVRLMPEHDIDCFDIGYLANKIPYVLHITSDTDNHKPQIDWMEISINNLMKNLKKGE